ncbi:MAG: hypothetical protein RBR22_08645 [Desulfuromonas sp.]|nr:hypothetical protein [Desulfuromonas sp.]
MKRVMVALGLMLCMAAPAFAVDFTFHGDFNHQFRLYSNHNDFMMGEASTSTKNQGKLISKDSSSDTFGLIKYRMWTTASSDDGAVKGVFAVELGGIRFGQSDKGGGFSGDGKNLEIRWAYTDFALAGGRVKIGLQPFKVNKFLWSETAMGIDYKRGDLELAWMRGYEVLNEDGNDDFKDLDGFLVRYNIKPTDSVNIGLFGLWQTSNGATGSDMDALDAEYAAAEDAVSAAEDAFDSAATADNLATLTAAQAALASAETDATFSEENYLKKLTDIDINLYTLGVDGGMTAGNLFVNWDLMYQFGDLADDMDFGGYLGHLDLGMKMGAGKLTYTFWYASGDDNPDDGDYDAFIATDVDTSASYSSIVLFESITDDNFFSTVPYIMDKGFIMNRVGYEYQVSDKLTVNAAAMYMMTAEDIEYTVGSEEYSDDSIGFEFDAGVSYKLYKSLTLSAQVGYLMADDALDYYEVDNDGNSDEDIYVINSGLRYKF